MQRAFRRPLNPGELNRYLSFWENIKDDFDRFEDGIKEVLYRSAMFTEFHIPI